MPIVWAFARSRLLSLLPLLIPFFFKNKKKVFLVVGLLMAYPYIKGLFASKVTNNKANLSLKLETYLNIAESQYNAMNGLGTDEETLFSDLQNLNKDELIEVYNSFGKRYYSDIGGQQVASFLNKYFHSELNIFGWYDKELDSTEIKAMRLIWQKTGLWEKV